MRFPETTIYEVWKQVGGADPVRILSGGLVTKASAEEFITEHKEVDKRRRPEAAPIHYYLVAATTTRREVH